MVTNDKVMFFNVSFIRDTSHLVFIFYGIGLSLWLISASSGFLESDDLTRSSNLVLVSLFIIASYNVIPVAGYGVDRDPVNIS